MFFQAVFPRLIGTMELLFELWPSKTGREEVLLGLKDLCIRIKLLVVKSEGKGLERKQLGAVKSIWGKTTRY